MKKIQEEKWTKIVCYACDKFNDFADTPTHLQCLVYGTYCATPEKADRCPNLTIAGVKIKDLPFER